MVQYSGNFIHKVSAECQFYNSFVAFSEGRKAYVYPVPTLNPPFFLWLFQGLSYYTMTKANLIWDIGSFLLVIAHFSVVWSLLKPELKKSLDPLLILSVYFLSYPVLVNGINGQVWALLSLLLLLGYKCLLKRYDVSAGLLWGMAAALKLSPLFLLIYLSLTQRYKIIFWTLLSFFIFSIIPYWCDGAKSYHNYLELLNTVHWFGHPMNASLYGLVFYAFPRFIAYNNPVLYFFVYKIACVVMLLAFYLYCWFTYKLIKLRQEHTAFCFTLTSLLILSPMNLLYTLCLLFYPMLFYGVK